MPYFNKER